MYEDFSADYDRFVDWGSRLAAEMPFIEKQLEAMGAQRVLDAACGTGMHAIALARRSYSVVGADASGGMIERARANAVDAGLADIRFLVASFGELAEAVGVSPEVRDEHTAAVPRFDALLCLGNSLPHILNPADLSAVLDDFAACLRPGGLLLIQNRNFDAVLAEHDRWMDPQGYREGDGEWLFVRFYDFDPDDVLTFNMVRLRREQGSGWDQEVNSTRLWPLTEQELTAAVGAAGFREITAHGDMRGTTFDPETSPNLVVAAGAPG